MRTVVTGAISFDCVIAWVKYGQWLVQSIVITQVSRNSGLKLLAWLSYQSLISTWETQIFTFHFLVYEKSSSLSDHRSISNVTISKYMFDFNNRSQQLNSPEKVICSTLQLLHSWHLEGESYTVCYVHLSGTASDQNGVQTELRTHGFPS